MLAALERGAGVPLLRRTGRRVALTPVGAALADQTEAVLALLEQASAALAAARAGLTGPLRIGAFPTAVRTILPAALVALGRDHPGLELMVSELDPAAVPDAPWIVGSPDTLCHTMAVRACQAAGFTPRIRHHADDFTTVLALVAAGQGVALVPQLGAIDPPADVTLTPLPTRRRTRIAYRKGTRHQPSVAACIAAIRDAALDLS